jgi:AraC-like DNA-binding protein/mannose-6-phosphate isomerase-like protein (cupin superfamily)
MDASRQSEFEVIRYDKIRHLHIFLVSILFRNMHEHSDFELDMILKGSAIVRCGSGQWQVGEGAMLLFSPYEPHEIASATPQPLQILSLQISNHFCKEYFPQLQNVEFTATLPEQALSRAQSERIRELALRTAICFLREEPSFQFLCVSTVSMLLYRLLEVPHTTIDDQEYMLRKRRTARIRRITAYIDQHYKERILLPDLAAMEGITTTYLSHFFHDTFHMTFQEYLNRLRLEKALILMKDPNLHLVDVCMECGFSDNKYLNRMFQKKFGCTASEYRKKRIVPDAASLPEPASYSEFRHSEADTLAILKQCLGADRYAALCRAENPQKGNERI